MAMGASGRGARSGINVTPLIDVLLVLLIIFMTIQPTAQHGLRALAPRPSHARGEPDPRTVVLGVGGDPGKPTYTLNDTVVSDADLQSRLERLVHQGGLQTISEPMPPWTIVPCCAPWTRRTPPACRTSACSRRGRLPSSRHAQARL